MQGFNEKSRNVGNEKKKHTQFYQQFISSINIALQYRGFQSFRVVLVSLILLTSVAGACSDLSYWFILFCHSLYVDRSNDSVRRTDFA